MMGLAEDFTGYKFFWSPCPSQDSQGGYDQAKWLQRLANEAEG